MTRSKNFHDKSSEQDNSLFQNRAWIYARMSPGDNQTIESQIMAAQNYCKEHDLIVDRIFQDDWRSGKSADDREGFMLMISLSKLNPRTASTIVMRDTKRFSRNNWDTQFYSSMLRRNGWKLVFVQDNIPDDPFLGPIVEVFLALMAQQQLYDIRAGTISGLRYIVAQGCLPNGQPAIGYIAKEVLLGGARKDGTLRKGKKPEVDQNKAPLVKLAFELKARGAPLQEIEEATQLFTRQAEEDDEGDKESNQEAKKILTGSWNHFFQNRAYIGEFNFHGEIFLDIYPPIIPRELFDAVQEKLPKQDLQERKIQDHPRRRHSSYLLANLSYCAYCGAPMIGRSTTGRKKQANENHSSSSSYRYYVCSQHSKDPQSCPQSGFINADDVEVQLFNVMTNQVLRKEYLAELLQWTNEQLNIESDTLRLRIEDLKSTLEKEDSINKKMHRNYLTLDEPDPESKKQMEQQNRIVESMRFDLARLEEIYKASHVETAIKEVEEFVQHAQEMIYSESIYDIKAVFERLIDHIVMHNDKMIVAIHFPSN